MPISVSKSGPWEFVSLTLCRVRSQMFQWSQMFPMMFWTSCYPWRLRVSCNKGHCIIQYPYYQFHWCYVNHPILEYIFVLQLIYTCLAHGLLHEQQLPWIYQMHMVEYQNTLLFEHYMISSGSNRICLMSTVISSTWHIRYFYKVAQNNLQIIFPTWLAINIAMNKIDICRVMPSKFWCHHRCCTINCDIIIRRHNVDVLVCCTPLQAHRSVHSLFGFTNRHSDWLTCVRLWRANPIVTYPNKRGEYCAVANVT